MNKLKCKAKNKEASETSPTIDISEFLLGKTIQKLRTHLLVSVHGERQP